MAKQSSVPPTPKVKAPKPPTGPKKKLPPQQKTAKQIENNANPFRPRKKGK